MTTLSLLLAFAVTQGLAAVDPPRQWQYETKDNGGRLVSIATTAQTPAGPRPAAVRLGCWPSTGLYIEVELQNADSIKGFNLDDYERPDAPFGRVRLATVTVHARTGKVVIRTGGAGWFSTGTAFVFNLSLAKIAAVDRTRFRNAMRQGADALEISLPEMKHPATRIVVSVSGNLSSPAIDQVFAGCSR